MGGYERYMAPIQAEGTTPAHSFRVRWRDGRFARLIDFDTARMSLHLKETGAILNSRSHQDILNANDVIMADETVDEETYCKITWNLQVMDTLCSTTNEIETHIATFEFVKILTGEVCNSEIHFPVENLREIP